MRADQRRPLVAYVLVSVACAFVLAPSLDLGSIPFGPKPSFSALSDTTQTPSERAAGLVDATSLKEAPDPEPVEQPVTDDGDSFAPGTDAIGGALENPLFTADDSAGEPEGSPAATVPEEPQSSTGDGGDAQLTAEPRSSLVGGGFAVGGSDHGGGDHGGSAGPDGSGVFDGLPSSNGGPSTSPGADGGSGSGSGDGEEPAPGPENGSSGPRPHSFDHVPPGEHPYGHVGPAPGQGPKDKDDKGDKGDNKGDKEDKSDKGDGPKDKDGDGKDKSDKSRGPKGNDDQASDDSDDDSNDDSHDGSHDRSQDKASKDKASKDKSSKDEPGKHKSEKDKPGKHKAHD